MSLFRPKGFKEEASDMDSSDTVIRWHHLGPIYPNQPMGQSLLTRFLFRFAVLLETRGSRTLDYFGCAHGGRTTVLQYDKANLGFCTPDE